MGRLPATDFVWDDEHEPIFALNMSWPDDDAPAPDRINCHAELPDWLPREAFPGLSARQIDAIDCYQRYGHYFGRQVLARNSYRIKDLLGRVVASAISCDDIIAGEVVAWSHRVFLLRLEEHDVRMIPSFDDVYFFAVDLSERLTRSGWPVRTEPYEGLSGS